MLLPGSLREMYALIGNRDDLTRHQDHLLRPAQLCIDDEVLVFRLENQGVAHWGVPLGEVGEPDPPVVFRRYSYMSADGPWHPFLSRVSLAGVEMLLSEWMLSNDEFADNRGLDEEAIGLLERQFVRLPMPDYPMWAEPSGAPTRWFGGRGAVLRNDADVWLWAQADSSDAIARVRQALPGEWLMADE
jgi:hypothetical protein